MKFQNKNLGAQGGKANRRADRRGGGKKKVVSFFFTDCPKFNNTNTSCQRKPVKFTTVFLESFKQMQTFLNISKKYVSFKQVQMIKIFAEN